MVLRKITPPGFELRKSIAAAIEHDRSEGITDADRTAGAILAVLDQAMRARCSDPDCVRRQSHSPIDSHLWKHKPSPPFTNRIFFWTCFTCGRRIGHKIHGPRQETDAP